METKRVEKFLEETFKEMKTEVFEYIGRFPNRIKEYLIEVFKYEPDTMNQIIKELLGEQKIIEGKITAYIANPDIDEIEKKE